MVNNINGLTGVQSSTSRSREKPQAQSDNAAATGSENTGSSRNGTDRVNLSAGAKDLQNIESKLKDFPEVNQDRVSHIKQALRDGTYSVDPSRLAAKIAQFELDL